MVTLRAQAEVGHPGLLLSMAHKTFYNVAKPGLPSLSGFSRLPRHHAPLLSQFPAFVRAVPTAQHAFPSIRPLPLPLLLFQGWLKGPCSRKPVSLPHEELIALLCSPSPEGDLLQGKHQCPEQHWSSAQQGPVSAGE